MSSSRFSAHSLSDLASCFDWSPLCQQKKAWADEAVMLRWLDLFSADTASLGPEELLIGMDNHGPDAFPCECRPSIHLASFPFCFVGAQQTQAFKAKLRAANNGGYTPPECTDLVSPCDHHVGAFFKTVMRPASMRNSPAIVIGGN